MKRTIRRAPVNHSPSRRALLKAGAALAAAAPLLPAAAAAQTRSEPAKPQVEPNRRILLKGGTIISLDKDVGDFAKGDILIEGKKIVAVRPSIDAAGARVIDAANAIVIPGFVDTHRHSWEGQLRRINPNAATLPAYSAATHQSFAKSYRPEDMYVGNLLTALGCIDAGITCVIDNSHNARSARHSDEAIRGLVDAGIRAVYAPGGPQQGDWDKQWPADMARLQKRYFSSQDQLVTLAMYSGPNRDNWAVARQLGLRICSEVTGPRMAEILDGFWNDKLVGPDNVFNHCGALPDATWRRIKDSGVSVNVCPRSDSQYGLGEGFPPMQKAIDHGVAVAFSVDNETSYSTDMFAEMRMAFHMQRALATNRKFGGDQNPPKPLSLRDVLVCATVNGAACAGLSRKIGTLTPGKEADVVLIRTNDINLYPSNNAIGTVVAAAESRNIDTVIIGGRIRKLNGKIVGLDWNKLRRRVDESRAHLFAKTGYKPDILAEEFKLT